jgi:hypothetical protein
MDTRKIDVAINDLDDVTETLEEAQAFIADLRDTNTLLRKRGDDWKQSALEFAGQLGSAHAGQAQAKKDLGLLRSQYHNVVDAEAYLTNLVAGLRVQNDNLRSSNYYLNNLANARRASTVYSG